MKVFYPILFPALVALSPSTNAGFRCDGEEYSSVEPSRNKDVIRERFSIPAKVIEVAVTSSSDVNNVMEKMVAEDVRSHAFRLEALFRLYQDLPGETPVMKKWRKRTKRLEDALGFYGDARSVFIRAKKERWPDQTLPVLQKEVDHRYRALAQVLYGDKWIDSDQSRANRLVERVAEISFPKSANDQTYILKHLIKEIKNIRDTKFALDELETGIHEFRRKLRWLLIQVHALRGKIEVDATNEGIDPETMAELTGLLSEPVDSRFVHFEQSADVKKKIKLPEIYYLTLSGLVGELGKIKDRGQAHLILANAFIEAKMENDLFVAQERSADFFRRRSKNPDYVAYISDAKALNRRMKKSGLFDRIIKTLEQQL